MLRRYSRLGLESTSCRYTLCEIILVSEGSTPEEGGVGFIKSDDEGFAATALKAVAACPTRYAPCQDIVKTGEEAVEG